MAKLKKRADGRYQLKVTLPNGQSKFVYGKTQREVMDKKADLLIQYGRGITDFRSIRFSDWCKTWWRIEKEGKTGFSSQTLYKLVLNNYIIPQLGNFLLQEIRPVHVQQLLNNVAAAGKSKELQNKIKFTLNAIFRYAVENGLIYGSPAQYAKTQGKPSTRQALTTAQQEELLNACAGMAGELIIKLAFYLGLRRGEIIGLHWTDLDRKAQTIHIQRAVEFIRNQPHEKSTKTAAGDRILPVPDTLWELLMAQEKKSMFIVPKRDGGQLTLIAFNRRVKPIYDKLSFKLTLHMLRHTYATRLDLLGVAPKTCQYLLGHASLGVTKEIYTHIQPEHLENARVQLNQL